MTQIELGKTPEPTAERDAIHLACYPAVAGERLNPGQRVGISRVTGNALGSLPYIGVVDPFLGKVVEKGERFWLCIRPGEVTGLRHHYYHPAFDRREANVEPPTEVEHELATN